MMVMADRARMTCMVCLEEEDMEEAGGLSRSGKEWGCLPCGHVMHVGCLKASLEVKMLCPMCRADPRKDARGKRRHMGDDMIRRVYLNTMESEQSGMDGSMVDAAILDVIGEISSFVNVTGDDGRDGAGYSGRDGAGSDGREGKKDKALRTCVEKLRYMHHKLIQKDGEIASYRKKNDVVEKELIAVTEHKDKLQIMLQDVDSKRLESIANANELAKKCEYWKNEGANLSVKLRLAKSALDKIDMTYNTSLAGAELAQRIKKLAEAGDPCPGWFQGLLEARNAMLSKDRMTIAKLRSMVSDLEKKVVALERKNEELQRYEEKKRKRKNDIAGEEAEDEKRGGGGPGMKTPMAGSVSHALVGHHRQEATGKDAADVIELLDSPIWEDEETVDDDYFTGSNIFPVGKLPFDGASRGNSVQEDASGSQDKKNRRVLTEHAAADMRRNGTNLFALAGPSAIGMKSAPGQSFIGRENRVGLEKGYVLDGSAGRGGDRRLYQSTASKFSGHIPTMIQLSQRNRGGGSAQLAQRKTRTKDIASFFKK